MSHPRRPVLAALVVFVAAACHRDQAAPPSAAVAPPSTGERGLLLDKIAALAEVAPCLADAGPAPLRLVDAELAGDAARVTFACANGARRGRVTFFRIAGSWTVSTKEIAR